jgi:hypothetical protein
MVAVLRKQNDYKFYKHLKGKMTERLKVTDCKSVGDTHRRFKSYSFQSKYTEYDAVRLACLFWEQEVMCSNHIIPKEDMQKVFTFLFFSNRYNNKDFYKNENDCFELNLKL